MNALDSLRLEIDRLDREIVSLLNQRCAVSISIGQAKKEALGNTLDTSDAHVHIPVRERAVYDKIALLNKGPMPSDAMQAIYREIMSASISLQKRITIAYLGPPGTYSHQSAFQIFGDSVSYSPQPSISSVFDAVESGDVTYGVVPFANSTFGGVQLTMDRLLTCTQAKVRAESYLSISHAMLSTSELQSITKVYSHSEAFGQAQQWLGENMKGVELVSVSSTAYAAQLAAKESGSAAICSVHCAALYGLQVVQEHIEDLKSNTTRFFLIGNKSEGPTGNDRTLLLFTVDHRNPGALCDALDAFKTHHVNVTSIDSRPSKEMNWHYYFFLEVEGHFEDAKVKDAIQLMRAVCLDLRVLGSYHNQKPLV